MRANKLHTGQKLNVVILGIRRRSSSAVTEASTEAVVLAVQRPATTRSQIEPYKVRTMTPSAAGSRRVGQDDKILDIAGASTPRRPRCSSTARIAKIPVNQFNDMTTVGGAADVGTAECLTAGS
jgi:ribosomal protein L30E